ncbi:hypothetical protein SLE2022_118910 [Rubroshorea leprosula]
MRNNINNDEPATAPEPNRWYDITLGSSFKDHHFFHPSPKFCTLRYEFKPASIDKNQPGLFHKKKDNRVTVEFQNNQHGKPKVTFEGISEDYRDNDAVLFFDGETFRLERLHRAVKRLRHVRQPGESAAAASVAVVTSVSPAAESSPPGKGEKHETLNRGPVHQMPVEQIDIGDSESIEPNNVKDVECLPSIPNTSAASLDAKSCESEEEVDIVNGDEYDVFATESKENAIGKESHTGIGIDINLPHQMDADDEIADVDISDDETHNGRNAAEALRAQVNAEGKEQQTSSSSSSSASESSESKSASGSESRSKRSVSSSSNSESSDGDSVTSI